MKNLLFKVYIIASFLLLLLSACRPDKYFSIQYSSPSSAQLPKEITMIVNTEQSNDFEGHYLKVLEVISDSTFRINLPHNFYLNNKNLSTWAIGWPSDSAYYAAGNENLARIQSINMKTGIVEIGPLFRGSGLPRLSSRIVFWSMAPSGYCNVPGKLIDPKWFKDFAGESIEFGSIIYDKISRQWIMYLQEVDNEHVQIYVASSPDLYNWKPANACKPLFTADDFKETTWAGYNGDGTLKQSARLYSAILNHGKWTFFLSGYSNNGNRHIGTIVCTNPLSGPFEISHEPIISTGPALSPDQKGCFYPKVVKTDGKFVMYYDGVAWENTETVCMAESKDLISWTKYQRNPVISHHYGWRSGLYTSEPNFIVCNDDTVWLMCGGYKKFNTEFNPSDEINGRLPLDTSIFSKSEKEHGKHISGNVMDAQLGLFYSTDGGYTFMAHASNPIWINNYADTLQNDHIGGDYFNTIMNGKSVIIYQAKSADMKRYNILLRER